MRAALKDELNWIEELPTSSQAQSELRYIHFGKHSDVLFFKKGVILQNAFVGMLN